LRNSMVLLIEHSFMIMKKRGWFAPYYLLQPVLFQLAVKGDAADAQQFGQLAFTHGAFLNFFNVGGQNILFDVD